MHSYILELKLKYIVCRSLAAFQSIIHQGAGYGAG